MIAVTAVLIIAATIGGLVLGIIQGVQAAQERHRQEREQRKARAATFQRPTFERMTKDD